MPTPLGSIRIGEVFYTLYLHPLSDDVVCIDSEKKAVLLTFKANSNIVEGTNGKWLGKFSLLNNCWRFHPHNSLLVHEWHSWKSLVDVEIEVCKMYLNKEI